GLTVKGTPQPVHLVKSVRMLRGSERVGLTGDDIPRDLVGNLRLRKLIFGALVALLNRVIVSRLSRRPGDHLYGAPGDRDQVPGREVHPLLGGLKRDWLDR